MAATKEQRQAEIILNGTQVNSTLKQLTQAASVLNTQLRALPQGTKEFTDKAKELENVRNNISRVTEEIKKLGEQNKFASGSLGDLRLLASQLTKELDKLAPETAEFAQAAKTLKNVESQIKGIETAIKGTDKEIVHATGSLNALTKQADTLEKELNGLAQGTEAFKNKAKELGQVNQRIAQIRTEVASYSTEQQKATGFMAKFGQIAQQATAYIAGMFAVGSIQNFIQYMGQVIGLAGKISDQFADIQKTTGMSAKEVRGFAAELQKLDTRTSLPDLLNIAKIGGQIGIAKKELLGFVESVDKAVVALGDEFTGGAEQVAKELGVLKGLFKETKNLEAGKALNDIGSAINALGASGSATGPVIAEFTKRMGALPGSIAPSIQNTMGLGAAFEEMGLTAEISSGGLTNVFLTMGEKSALFAQQLGISKAEFDKMFNQDSNATVLKVAESFKGLSDTQLIETMKRLGIGTQESIKVMGVLSNSTDLVRSRQELANIAMAKGTSLTEEFNIKNNTLQADMEKNQKAIDGFTLALGNFFSSFVGGVLRGFAQALKGFKDSAETIEQTTSKFNKQKQTVESLAKNIEPLIIRYEELKEETKRVGGETKLSEEKQKELRKAIDQIGAAIPSAVTGFDKYGVALGINTEKAKEFIKTQQGVMRIMNEDLILKQKQALEADKQNKLSLERERKALPTKTVSRTSASGQQGAITKLTEKEMEAEYARINDAIGRAGADIKAREDTIAELSGKNLDKKVNKEKEAQDEIQKAKNRANAESLNAQANHAKEQEKKDKEAKDALLRAQQEYEDLKNSIIENQYDREIAQINTETNRKVEEVKKNGNLVNEQTTLLELQRSQRIAEVNRKRIDDRQKAEAEQLKQTIDQATAFVQEETNAILVANESAYLQKTEQANRLFEEGKIREDERLALIEEARFEREQADLEAEAMRLRALIALKTMIGQEETTEAQRLANQLLAIEQKKNDDSLKHQKETNQKKKEDDKKLLEAKHAIQDAELGLAKDFFGLVEAIAGKNKEVQRGLLAVNALVAIAEVNMNLQRSLMAIQAVHGWNPVANATLSTIAKVRAGIAVGTIIAQTAQKFEKGGVVSGPSHAQGGVRGTGKFSNIEVEGGEFITNTLSTANNLPSLRMINANPNTIFDVVPRTRFGGGGQLGGGASALPAVSASQAQASDMTAQMLQRFDMLLQLTAQNTEAIKNIKLQIGLLDLQKDLNDLEARQSETTSRG